MKQPSVSRHQPGFVMPTVIILMSIMAFVAYAALLQANNGLNLAYKQAYIQMARVASKAAVDYAQEQFDNATCGNYTGTAETDLVSNSRYRVTFKSEITNTSADGFEKTVKGTGSVYLPKLSATAQYVFDIRSEIVRTYAVCKTPDNFAPLVWLDASDTTKLKKSGVSTTNASGTTSFGSAGSSTRDTLEERADNGSQTTNSWQSNDLEMHICDNAEFSSSICSNNSSRYLNIGMIFSGINVPQGATITSANIEMVGGNPSGTSGSVTHRVYGIYKTSTNPHPDLFTSSGSNQLSTKYSTANLHTSTYEDISTNNFPPGNTTTFDVTDIAQEIVNNANWNPTGTGNGGRMGFLVRRQSGSGSRRATKNGLTLTISYSTVGAPQQANNNDALAQWDDKSGHNYNAIFAYGAAPLRIDNQINGKTIVRFSNGNLLSTLSPALTSKREMTVLAVVKSSFSTSSSDGRMVSGMSSSGTNDTTSGSSIIPLMRYGSGNGFSSIYSGSGSTYRTDYTCGSTCNNNTYLYTSVFTINNSNSVDANLRGNGAVVGTKNNMSPSGSPYTFGIDQLYYGGRRTGAMAGGSGTDYFNGDYAEIIVYDKALECQQIEAIEEYLRAKWAVSGSVYTSTCPPSSVPTL